MMYLSKTPQLFQNLFPYFTWRIPTEEKAVFLTFDDGPVPEVTPWVLDELRVHRAKATFFCVGDNIAKYPHLYSRIIEEGHQTGSHSYNHVSGWTTGCVDYLHNVRFGASTAGSNLFRPPYGRIGIRQARFLRKHYRIIMWDVLSGDFDTSISPDACLQNVIRNVEPGSIIVFHDSVKAAPTLFRVLPGVLQMLAEQGYFFRAIPT